MATKVTKKEVAKEPVKTEEKVVTKTETKKPSQSSRLKEIKKNMKDIDVEIMNITGGTFYYEKGNDIVEMQEPGETKVVSLDILLSMNRDFLNKLFISVVDCLDDYELEDILTVLNISDTYKHIDVTLEGMDNFLMGASNDEFDKKIRQMPDELIYRLVERAIILDKKNKFDSYAKRKSLETRLNNPYLFKAV